MMFVLDTNVVSELRKVRLGKIDINVTAGAESVDATDLFVSAITVMELEPGVLSVERRSQPVQSVGGSVMPLSVKRLAPPPSTLVNPVFI